MSLNAPRHWTGRNLIALLLLPVAVLFGVLAAIRRWCYRTGLFKSYRVSVPVVIIGNITAGGAGKTPLVIALVESLKRGGINVGVVSGGYGGSSRGGPPVWVSAATDPAIAGDESVLIAQRTAVPVVVGRDRVAAAQQACGHCDVIICDDGLQHYALQRDIEIAVVDSQQLLGNEFLLPAGPLRESKHRLTTVDLVVYSGSGRQLAGYELEPDAVINLRTGTKTDLAEFAGKTVHAVAAIAYPDKFFSVLVAHGVKIIEHRFPDHFTFSPDDLNFGGSFPVLMTEKDKVKCQRFARDNHWFLSVRAIVDTQTIDSFNRLLASKGVISPGD